jgi:oligopeptide/dipeptide ABC transporter ATP-binding protein
MSQEIALQAVNLVKYFTTGSSGLLGRATSVVQAVDGVSFTLPVGKSLGIVGESGCGKSTLARLVTRLIEPSSGSVLLDGVDITSLSGKALREIRRKLQMIFQDPYSSLNPRHSIGQIIGDPMRIQGIVTKGNEKAEVQELMQRVGLNPEHYNRYPHEFSGGQRQRIGIARALSLRPSVIVADEPVSALDVSIQAQILNLLENLQKDLGLSFVFIAHDLSVVRHIADQVAVMYLGKIVEVGDSATVYNSPAHPYTKALLSCLPARAVVRDGRRVIQAIAGQPGDFGPACAFAPRCPMACLWWTA